MITRVTETFMLPIVKIVVQYTPLPIWTIIEFIIDLFTFWFRRMYGFYYRKDPLKDLLDEIKTVQTYSQWKNKVNKIDKLTNMDLWRQDLVSKHYDYILVDERLKLLRAARHDQDSQRIMSLLRSGLVRNFGGISQKRLFTKAYLGTKHKIEEYIEEVLACLNYLNESINTPSNRDNVEYIMNSKQLKLDFFHDVRQSFGCTALVLQGGSLFGLCHLGVVKALYFKGLLPRIIGGSAVGAAVASLVGTLTDEELIPTLISIQDAMGDVDRLNHDVDERYGNVIENVVKKGYSQDILIFLKFVRDTIGDLTFEEAYLKTEKVLNIVVHPSHSSVPSLLNYITSPNVIIWTAIYASIGTGVLSDNVQLYVKDFNNNIVPKEPNIPIKFMKPQDVSYLQHYFKLFRNEHSDVDSSDGNRQNLRVESPYTRLTELFNVNHFINSLARPYLAPLISNDLKHFHAYGKVRYNYNSLEEDAMQEDDADLTFGYLMDEPQREAKNFVIDKRKSFMDNGETYTRDTSLDVIKHMKNLLGLEVQHRLEVMNKLGLLSDVVKRFFIDEKPAVAPSLAGIREVSIVPELRYLLADVGRVFDVHKTMENIPYWVLVGERSVWPLLPLLWVRCSIEFTLDDLYNLHRKK